MTRKDLGLAAVEQAYREMQIDAQWSVREPRGFTWWGSWVRQRVWAGEAVRSRGETLWHVRARTPAYRDQPDEPATYRFVNGLNQAPELSAWVFDPDDGTASARCGVFTYDGIDGWIERFLRVAVALQSSIAWLAVPAVADGRPLDDAPHPASGPRKDPDDMLNLARTFPGTPSPFTMARLRDAAGRLAAQGAAAEVSGEDEGGWLQVVVPVSADAAVLWSLQPAEHPLLGSGVAARLFFPWRSGPVRAAWIANGLNLAEQADWSGEDRPHALGAWSGTDELLAHTAFFPAVLFGDSGDDSVQAAVTNLLAWATVRAGFAAERIPWLSAAAASRFPDDDPPEGDDGDGGESDDDDGGPGGRQPDGDADAAVPIRERSFGPASRVPRPPTSDAGAADLAAREPRELVVDPADPAAYREIDDAVADAEDGDRIMVRPGTYRQPVVVDRAVTITGDGPVGDIRLEPVGGEALGVAASGATVRGLAIRPARAGNDGTSWSAVAVHDAAVTVEACDLTSHLGATVWIGGPSSLAVLTDCTIANGVQNGVWVVEEGRAELVRCRVRGHRWPVMAGGAHASLAVTDSEIEGNLDDGIVAAGGATLVIERTRVAGNGSSGILLLGATPASRVVDCTVEENTAIGIGIEGGRGSRILRTKVRRNGVGIAVTGGGAPVIEGNELDGNRVGIGVRGDDSDPVVRTNTVTGGSDQGVIVDESAAGRFEGNHVSRSGGAGVWVDDAGTRPVFEGNHVSACGKVGILVTDGAGGVYRSNDLRGNMDGSWGFHTPGELTRDGNLEDTGLPRPAAGADGADEPPAGPRLVN